MTKEGLYRRTATVIVTSIFLLGVGCSSSAPTSQLATDGAPPPDGPSATEIMDKSKKNKVTDEQMEEANNGRPSAPTEPVGILPDERNQL